MKSWWPYSFDALQIKAFENVLDQYENPQIFEYGGGNSTRYFTRYYLSDRQFNWNVVEDDLGWANKITAWNLQKVTIYYEPNVYKYIHRIGNLHTKFDIIFIDGIERNECLKVARGFLSDNGCILLHDAYRKSYLEGKELYSGEYLTEDKMLWKGVKK